MTSARRQTPPKEAVFSSAEISSAPPVVAASSAFPRTARVTKRFEYRRIQQQGRKVHAPHFLFFVLMRPANDGSAASGRLGVTVTKKIANAVGRNRVKRLLREGFRHRRALFGAHDIVALAKAGAHELSIEQVSSELELLARALRAGRAGGRAREGDRT